MEIKIVARKENPLLNRSELEFSAVHSGEVSPSRDSVREEIAKLLKVSKEVVLIDRMEPEFGWSASKGYAKIYKTKEDALRFERKHVLIRNNLLQAKGKGKEKGKEKEE